MDEYRQAENKYAARLRRALELVQLQLPIPGVELTVITAAALIAFRESWRDRADRRVTWDWTERDFRPSKGLNVAIWHDGRLCGLVSGPVTRSAVRLDYIEAFPGDNALKDRVILLALTCAEAYCRQVGVSALRLNAVIPPLIERYERYGFELAPESRDDHIVMRKALP